jgi:5-methylcytosine-specific restriction endonuclease McrA
LNKNTENIEHQTETDRSPLRDRLITLHRLREQGKTVNRRPRQHQLRAAERATVLRKTGGKCHICGGDIRGSWHADHVLAHSAGGKHATDNYLPAHGTCNNYRWDYLAEEFELILKLGVWARTQVETR